jgi:hypothetical protein
MWNCKNLFAQPFFTAVMSKDMYQSVFQFIRFDNTATRQNYTSAIKKEIRGISLHFFLKHVIKTIHQAIIEP